jgi:hypothetical protein
MDDLFMRECGQGLAIHDAVQAKAGLPSVRTVLRHYDLGRELRVSSGGGDGGDDHGRSAAIITIRLHYHRWASLALDLSRGYEWKPHEDNIAAA